MGDDDVLELIRVACGAVAERARFVRIDSDVLAAYPQRYENDAGAEPEDGVRTPAGDDEATTALVLQLDAINFGSGWHPVLYKRPGLSGSRMVAACWRERAERDGVMTAGELAVIDGAAVAAILEQESEGPAGDLMRLFARSLAELGCHLLGHYGGSFSKFVASANGSAAALTTALTGLPMWQDAADHDDAVVPLFKRAQIVSADLARAFAGSGPGAFNDLDRLTLFADNVVPHVLRLDGVLVYDNAPGAAHRCRRPARAGITRGGRDPRRRRARRRAAGDDPGRRQVARPVADRRDPVAPGRRPSLQSRSPPPLPHDCLLSFLPDHRRARRSRRSAATRGPASRPAASTSAWSSGSGLMPAARLVTSDRPDHLGAGVAGGDRLEHGRHADQVGPQHAQHPHLGRGLVVRPPEARVHAFRQRGVDGAGQTSQPGRVQIGEIAEPRPYGGGGDEPLSGDHPVRFRWSLMSTGVPGPSSSRRDPAALVSTATRAPATIAARTPCTTTAGECPSYPCTRPRNTSTRRPPTSTARAVEPWPATVGAGNPSRPETLTSPVVSPMVPAAAAHPLPSTSDGVEGSAAQLVSEGLPGVGRRGPRIAVGIDHARTVGVRLRGCGSARPSIDELVVGDEPAMHGEPPGSPSTTTARAGSARCESGSRGRTAGAASDPWALRGVDLDGRTIDGLPTAVVEPTARPAGLAPQRRRRSSTTWSCSPPTWRAPSQRSRASASSHGAPATSTPSSTASMPARRSSGSAR